MHLVKIGSSQTKSVLLLQAMLKEGNYLISIDGRFGMATNLAVRQFQLENDLVSDGIVGEKTWTVLYEQFPELLKRIRSKYLSETDIEEVAEELKLEAALVKAVNEVEARGSGFIIEEPKILFEGHWFWRRLKHYGIDPENYSDKFPNIIYYPADRNQYFGGTKEYERLNRALEIHEIAALESASWGSFQVMGFNAVPIGYDSVKEFVDLMKVNEKQHLRAFTRFLEHRDLTRYLRSKNWAAFAKGYNGRAYSKNRYDKKLAQAYRKYS